MLNYQENQDFVPIDRTASESCTLHLPKITEQVSVQTFLDRIMQYQVDPAQVGRQICQIIATNSDREQLLSQVANALGTAYQANFCLVATVTDKKVAIPNACWQSRSDRANSSDIIADSTQKTEFSATTSLNSPFISPVLSQVLADGEVAGISDIQDSPVGKVPNFLGAALPFRAVLAAPVRSGGAIDGIIMVGKSQPYEWSIADKESLEAVSDSIAIAISHIQKTEEITSLNQKLKDLQAITEDSTAQLQQSLEIQAKLYQQSADQLEQLRKWKHIKDDLLDAVNHELRTPLTIMRLAIVMLKQAEQPSEIRAKYLDILEQKCSQEIGLIEDLLAVKQFESQQLHISPLQINLKHLIQDLVRDFEQKWADKRLTLRVKLPKSLPPLESDRDILHRILLELLTNAGKFSAAGTVVALQVSVGAAGQIVMSVSNCGRGISTADLPDIFEKFYRGNGITHQVIPGMGFGLALVKCLVQHLNGTIDVSSYPADSAEADGLSRTCFTLTLPQFQQKLSSLENK